MYKLDQDLLAKPQEDIQKWLFKITNDAKVLEKISNSIAKEHLVKCQSIGSKLINFNK